VTSDRRGVDESAVGLVAIFEIVSIVSRLPLAFRKHLSIEP
jgi:hypothetical protein